MRHVLRIAFGALVLSAVGALTACDGGSDSTPPPPPVFTDRVPLPEQKPTYDFAPGLEQEHPEVVAFMRHFLETCMAGDYAGYRRLVTRIANPESRGRFEKILHALQSLSVKQIRPIELPDVLGPAYVVTAHATFRQDEQTPRRRGQARDVAILVLLEDDEWRMGLAPAELQPPLSEPEPTTAPAETGPDYPWEKGIDY